MSEKKFVELAGKMLDEAKMKNLLEFSAFLKRNKLKKRNMGAKNLGVSYNSVDVCTVRLQEDFWLITYFKDYYNQAHLFNKCEEFFTGELKDFIISNINTVPGSVTGCKNCDIPKNKTIFGKSYDEVCNCHQIVIKNPCDKTLEYAKEIVIIAINTISNKEAN